LEATAVNDVGTVREAAGMRVKDVECLLFSQAYPQDNLPRWSGGALTGATLALVRITTEDGLFGLGETYAGNFAPQVVKELVAWFAPLVCGKDPSEIAAIWQDVYSRILFWGRSGIAVSVLGAVELALWDLCGKAVGKPVVDLLGGSVHRSLPRYASGGLEQTDAELVVEMRLAGGLDFSAVKMRGGDTPESDAHRFAVARDALPDDMGLALDAVQGSAPVAWPIEHALALGREIEQYSPLWLEEPAAPTDFAGYARCRRELNIPIAGGETATTLEEFQAFFDHDALDIVQPDVSHTGGILRVRQVAVAAGAAGVKVAPHSWLGAGSVMGNYHLAFATPNAVWLEFPTQPNSFVSDLLAESLTVEGGRVSPPRLPGLGITLPDDFAERYPYRPGLHYHFEDRRSQDPEGLVAVQE
jgi:L-alanine-DL-glutamate epimerase-like enolase superfamily enzyme